MRRSAIQLVSTGGFYGAEKALLELAAYLSTHGWDSHIIALEGKGTSELQRRARDCGIDAAAFADGSRVNVLSLAVRLRRTLADFPQAIVHSHGYKPDILLATLRVPKRLCCIATCHSWYSDTAKMKAAEWLDKRLLRGFDHVVAVSDEIGADLLASGIAIDDVSRVTNGISVPTVEPDARLRIRAALGIGSDELLVVQIGRLARSKRNDLLLEAVARLPDTLRARVLLVGEGDQYAPLVERARTLGILDRVTFCGYRSDVPSILASADVLALTSDKEGLPIVLLEAMAVGCPIVSSAVGAVPTVLSKNESAWIVPVDDIEALRRAIEEALSDRALAKSRAVRAKSEFLKKYSRDAMGQRYLEIYDRMWYSRGWN